MVRALGLLVTGVLVVGCLDADLRGARCHLDGGADDCGKAGLQCRFSPVFGDTVCETPRDGGNGAGGGVGGSGGGGGGGAGGGGVDGGAVDGGGGDGG